MPARPRAYLAPEKRLSKVLACTIGCDPATKPGFGDAAASATVGFGGEALTCLISGLEGGFGVEASGRGVSVRFASITFGLAGIGWAVAVVSEKPTLRARLLKKPSDGAFGGVADATLVAGAAGGVIEATSGSCGAVTGPRGGLTVEGMVPGARKSAINDRP